MGLKFEGFDEFRSAFQRLRDDGAETIDNAVRDHMEHDLYPEVAIRVPKHTGALLGTAVISPGDKIGSWKLTLGDSSGENDMAVDYAAAVHNELNHRHTPPSGPRFVSEPLREGVERLAERTAKALDDLAGG